MSERQQHMNPWAEKLSQVSLPNGAESWKAMEAILDREMPARPAREWRRWVLVILLLLLLIGVCHCPGKNSFRSGGMKVEEGRTAGSVGGTKANGPAGPSTDTVVQSGPKADVGEPVKDTETVRGSVGDGAPVRSKDMKKNFDSKETGGDNQKVQTKKKNDSDKRADSKKDDGPTTLDNGPNKNIDGAKTKDDGPGIKTDGPQKKIDGKKIDGKKTGSQKTEDNKKTDPAKKKDADTTEREHGWMVGVGLNQFFTIGGQQASSFNSGGLTGTLGDYIPVPMVRYYFSPELYVQLEAQINTPQYTKKNLVAVQTKVDSLSPVQSVQRSVSINKLFYFNVPLSVHYTVYDHLDLGTGLQYSRLTNGIGVFNANYNNSGVDSLATETKSFKGDTVYQKIKTYEFRFLVDANYTWKHFILGVRYNQALSKFIHVELQPGQITQARNSSLQLYLRYILWDGRKKKETSAPK